MRLPRLLAMAVSGVLVAGAASVAVVRSESASTGPVALTAAGQAVVFAGGGSRAGGGPATGSPTSVLSRGPSRPSTGLSVPAAGVPLSQAADPVEPAPVTGTVGGRPAVILPTPNASTLPSVDHLSEAVTPDAVVMLSSSLTPAQSTALHHLKGVTASEVVDTGTVEMGGAPVVAFGVDPDTFRAYTPPASAGSDQLWRYLKGGSLVSSYPMAHDRALKLGSTQVIDPAAGATSAAPVQGWLGAFASIGLPGVDLLVDHTYSPVVGLTPRSGVIVSAPGLSGGQLQSELQAAMPGAAVELLYAQQLPSILAGDVVGSSTRDKIIAAALSKVGAPYVWGGAGPDVFDCSGLVQWSYRQAGILMPRVAAEQFLTGNHIPLADAQPGDLLFWAYDPSDPNYVDHVAIYLGNGMMVVAPHTGTDVQISPIPMGDFMGVVQVVLQKS